MPVACEPPKGSAVACAWAPAVEINYDFYHNVTPEKLRDKLREHHDQVLMGRELSTIVRDLPVEIGRASCRERV